MHGNLLEDGTAGEQVVDASGVEPFEDVAAGTIPELFFESEQLFIEVRR